MPTGPPHTWDCTLARTQESRKGPNSMKRKDTQCGLWTRLGLGATRTGCRRGPSCPKGHLGSPNHKSKPTHCFELCTPPPIRQEMRDHRTCDLGVRAVESSLALLSPSASRIAHLHQTLRSSPLAALPPEAGRTVVFTLTPILYFLQEGMSSPHIPVEGTGLGWAPSAARPALTFTAWTCSQLGPAARLRAT